MLLFLNLIFRKSSFNVKLDLMKIELFGKIHMELEFHSFFFLVWLCITWFLENRVLK